MKNFIFTAILIITSFSAMLGQTTLTDGLQLYYTFNGNVTDNSPNNISATVNGATLTTSRFGTPDSAYYFNGSNAYILCDEEDEILNQNFDAFTISVWVNPESLNTINGGRVINNRGTGGVENGYSGYQMCLVREPSLVQWGISNTVVEDEDDFLNPCGALNFCGDFYDFNNIWHHYVMVYDSGSMTLYMDAINQGVDTSSTFEDISNNLPTVIGASGSQSGVFGTFSQFFQGKIDDIRIYDRALSTDEITELYVFNDDELSIEDVINPVSATTTLSAEFGSNLDNTINGSGLDAFPSLSATHEGTNPGNAFYATNDIGIIDFDLGGSFLVDGLSFWNVNATGPPQTGIQNVIIYSSEDGVTYTVIAGSPTVFAEATQTTSEAEQFSFTEVTTSFIRIEVTSNYGSPDFVGFAEVAFSGIEVAVEENVINPVSATTTLSAQFGSSIDNTINGNGLDAFPSLSATHEMTTPGNSFLATNETGSIDFDLGGSYLVDGLSFWNENAPGPGQTGIQEVVVSSSEDGITYTPISGSPSTFAQVVGSTSPAEQFSFATVTASYIRFDVLSNYGDPGNLVAFAEVAFSGIEVAVEENVINPVSATTTLSAEFGSNLDNTINGSGLDAFPSLSATHEGTNPGNAFYATNDVGIIDFDLGGSFLVDGLSFWNVNATGPPQAGIQNVIIYSSEDGVTYTAIVGSPTVFAEATQTISEAEQFSFTEVTTSFIRIEVTSNYGSPDFVGFAEVAFSGTEILGVTDTNFQNAISIYPNPARDNITINNSSNTTIENISVYDMNGRLVQQVEVFDDGNNPTINVSELSPGIYMVHIFGNQASIMKRVIKK